MFKFFASLARLTANVDALSASVAEAHTNFRVNLGLDEPAAPEQIEHDEPAAGKRRKAT